MTHPKLEVQKRTVIGKQVKKLRRENLLPANIYGKELASVAVQVKFPEFETVFKEVGETGLVDVMLDGERRPVLIKNIQWNYRTRTPLHADFYQVNLKEKVKSMVPLVVTGEPKAVSEKLGVLLTPLSEVEVEALPEALPENIEVNVESLANLDEQITIADLKAPDGVTILTQADQVVARIGEMMKEEEVQPTEEAQMPEVIGEAEKAAEGEEPAPTAESEKKEEK
jgi:large subunit ribosomal protein L25